jgi:hypothetical protein
MTQQQIVTGLVITASLVVAFMLGQTDVALPPLVKVLLGAANVALTYWARVSNGGTAMTTITTSAPAQVTAQIEKPPTATAGTASSQDEFSG